MIRILSVSSPAGGIFGFLGGIFKGIFRAGGGPVTAGMPYIVGEKEAEIFVPNTNGMILNQKQIGQMLSGLYMPSVNSGNNFSNQLLKSLSRNSQKNVNNVYISSSLDMMKFYKTSRKSYQMGRNLVRM